MKSSTIHDIRKNYHLQAEVGSPQQTEEMAGDFSKQLIPGDVVAFYGDLGSGKTFFIKAICKNLGTLQNPTSPSFTIINEYYIPDNLYIYHFDFYRLESYAELVNIGLDEYFYNDNICLIEWADKIEDLLPENRWEVNLKFVNNLPDSRQIEIRRVEE